MRTYDNPYTRAIASKGADPFFCGVLAAIEEEPQALIDDCARNIGPSRARDFVDGVRAQRSTPDEPAHPASLHAAWKAVIG